jgi:hypothetical protein
MVNWKGNDCGLLNSTVWQYCRRNEEMKHEEFGVSCVVMKNE